MPLYEYKCTKCGSAVETIQKVSDSPMKICSQCGGPLNKLISSPAIQFKGTGWYVTDYARKSTEAQESKKENSPDAAETKAKDASKKKKETSPAEKNQSSPSAN